MAQFFKGNYGSALGSTANAANLIAQAGQAQGQMFANLGQTIGSSIEKFRENKAKKEKEKAAENLFIKQYENNPASPIFESFGIKSSEEAKAVAKDISKDPALVNQAMQFAQNTMMMNAQKKQEQKAKGSEQFTRAMLGTKPKAVPSSDSKIRDFFAQAKADDQAKGLAGETNPEDFRKKVAGMSGTGELNPEAQRLAANRLMQLQGNQQAASQAQAEREANLQDKMTMKQFESDLKNQPKGPKDMSGPTIVNDSVNRAMNLIGPFTTGYGSYLKSLPATDAKTLDTTLETIRANIGFDKLQAMREASPTGGALGAVSERELSSLQAVFGNLDQSQKEKDLKYNLQLLQHTYNNIIHGEGNHSFAMPSRDGKQSVTKDMVDQAKRQLEARKKALGK